MRVHYSNEFRDKTGRESIILIDQGRGSNNSDSEFANGWAVPGVGAVLPLKRHFDDVGSIGGRDAREFYNVLAHELGHLLLLLDHPHEKVDDRHNELAYEEDLAKDEYRIDRPHLCTIMSYCGSVNGFVTDYNTETGRPIWIACGQRKILGWPDGPPTPYGMCRDGEHILNSKSSLGRAINLVVEFEWDHETDSPVAVVKWDSYVENSGAKVRYIQCGPLPTQLSNTRDVEALLKHREDGLFRRDVKSNWQQFGRAVREDPSHSFLYEGGGEVRSGQVLKKGQKYQFWVQINCAGGHASSPSESISATTPKAWKPTPPGKPNPTKVEDRYISIDWQSALGEVERHEIQWRPARTTSPWEQRLQPNAGRFFGKDRFAPGTCYEFRVRAGNDAGWSDWSQTARVCTESGLIPPDPPRDLVLRSGTGAIEVAWDAAPENGSAVTGYNVRWRDSSILSSINPALRVLAWGEGVEQGPVGFSCVEQDSGAVVVEVGDPERHALDQLGQVVGCFGGTVGHS